MRQEKLSFPSRRIRGRQPQYVEVPPRICGAGERAPRLFDWKRIGVRPPRRVWVPLRPRDTASRIRKDRWEPEGARQTSPIVRRDVERRRPWCWPRSREIYLPLFFNIAVVRSGRSSGRMNERPKTIPFFLLLLRDFLLFAVIEMCRKVGMATNYFSRSRHVKSESSGLAGSLNHPTTARNFTHG